ncbi:MAG: hypothetical protein ACK55I_06300, partial [bacterium]
VLTACDGTTHTPRRRRRRRRPRRKPRDLEQKIETTAPHKLKVGRDRYSCGGERGSDSTYFLFKTETASGCPHQETVLTVKYIGREVESVSQLDIREGTAA